MTDLMDPTDTGEIPAPVETTTRDLRHAVLYRRPDTTGEMPRLIAPPLFGMRPRPDARVITGEILPYASYSPEPGEPPRPLPVPPPTPTPPPPAAADTVTMSLFDSLTGWMNSVTGDPKPPQPLPNPGPPPKPRHAWNAHRADHYPVVKPSATPRDIPWSWAPRRQELAPWKVALTAGIAVLVAEVLVVGSILAVAL